MVGIRPTFDNISVMA